MMTDFTPIIHPWNQTLWQHLSSQLQGNHALLFHGDQGLGKLDLGIALSHHLIANQSLQSAQLFAAGSHPDIHIVMPEALVEENLLGQYAQRYLIAHKGKNPKQVISIDQIRLLDGALATHPHIAILRVIVLAAAETMNNNAANALLKNLEEPPANTLFIVITDELTKLAKTVRSRCSLVNFRAPEKRVAREWLSQQNCIPEEQLDTYLATANNHPLLAQDLYKSNYMESLKMVFTDLNNLWRQQSDIPKIAKQWQQASAISCIEIVQKILIDLLRCRLSDQAKVVFYPVQQPWLQKVSAKLSKLKLLTAIDKINQSKRLLGTTVDELLVIESTLNQLRQLPQKS